MKRIAAVLLVLALTGCGGDGVNFNLDNPPRWLRNVNGLFPAKPLRQNEIASNCFGVAFSTCTTNVLRSKSLVRKARFAVIDGREVRVTYTPNEKANDVVISARPEGTIPVRKSGGVMRFDCIRPGVNGCMVQLQ
jgi:hypothetical protein